jgi:hypothetical protein
MLLAAVFVVEDTTIALEVSDSHGRAQGVWDLTAR